MKIEHPDLLPWGGNEYVSTRVDVKLYKWARQRRTLTDRVADLERAVEENRRRIERLEKSKNDDQ